MSISTASEDQVAIIRNRIWYGLLFALTVWLALVPVTGGNLPFYFYLMLWITMASAFNIISGFTGYMPFGYVAFYGIGAFTTAILTKKLGVSVYFSIPVAGLAGVILSLLFAKTLKLSGIYFAIVSLALSIILRLVITNMPEEITGGSFGISLGSRAEPVKSFYVMLVTLLAALSTAAWLARSRLGKALKAIRDDSEAAAVMGINVPRARLLAWMIAAFFPAICGGIEAWYTNIVDTETAFDILITAKTIIYSIAGGLGTVTGPIVGTVIMVVLDDLIWQQFPLLNLFLLGLVIVLLIQFMPRGIVGTMMRVWPVLRRYIL
ncbi:MAG: branched-chain amino acid ABC transporter permease [Alphaproteobacteria bacterium]|nr:branched-chain amino acid ABC transporter permease [Alphaproteobacteria bacterium]